MTPYFDSSIHPTEELLQLKRMEGIYVLLNTSKNLYASVFDFADPWKIDILDFLEHNYMNDISMEEMANYTGRSYPRSNAISKNAAHSPHGNG